MSASTTCSAARVAARVAAVVLIGIGVGAAAAAPSEALGLPGPTPSLAEPLTPVGDVADQLTRPLPGAPLPAPVPAPVPAPAPAPAPALPAPLPAPLRAPLPAPLPSEGTPASPGPGGSGSTSPAQSGGQSTPSGRARAGGDDLVAVDAEVEGLLGLCVRVPRDLAQPRADVVVLDRDLIAVLAMAGVPVREVIAPCPADVGSTTGETPRATGASSTNQAASVLGADPGAEQTDDRLAFTGAQVVPTTLLASGLLWLGGVLTLTSRRLALVPQGA